MHKIYFRDGTMYSGKSTDLIKSYLSDQRYKKVIALKPSLDTRDDELRSRIINVSIPCVTFTPEESIISKIAEYFDANYCVPDVIYIDEIQFCTDEQIIELHELSFHSPIMCYGLKNSFTGELFPAISTLLSIAEDVKEIKHSCCMCRKKATHNLLVRDDKPIYDGEIVNIEGENPNEKYYAVCRKHFFEPIL